MRNLSEQVLDSMQKAGIIAVVVIEEPDKAVKVGRAFLDAGLDIVEVAMRTERAIQAIRVLKKELPELVLGAGTILSLSAAKEAIGAGARFIVSPHLDEEIVTYCIDNDIACVPGVFTPSEIQRAIKAATKNKLHKTIKELPLVIKIFPASTGGPQHIRALRAVFPDVRFVPLGGVGPDNLADYCRAGAWAVGGTWICRRELIDKNDFAKITELTKEALRIIGDTRKSK